MSRAAAFHYLTFTLSEDTDGVATIEAMASTTAAEHATVMAEVQTILDWAQRRFGSTQGAVEDGADWNDDLQVHKEEGGWHEVTLTLSASPAFMDAFARQFRASLDD